MKKIFIRLKSTGKIFSFEATDTEGKPLKLKENQPVLVENEQVIEEGVVLFKPKTVADIEEGKGAILRAMTPEDKECGEELKAEACQFIEETQKKVLRHGLNMTILDADLSFDRKKITFYFKAAGRVDFRGLVLDIHKSYEKLVRLQQVGAREEAKYFACLGKCGRELCCAKFLNQADLSNWEAKQAQSFSGAGGKLIGCCGKPTCCLAFEDAKSPDLVEAAIQKNTKKIKTESK